MKVNQDFKVNTPPVPKDTKIMNQSGINFQDVVKIQNQKLQMGQLHQLLSEIEKAGERLSKSRNFRDLAKYKSLVQSFLKETVDFGLDVKSSTSWMNLGQNRILKIVETIDEKLVELADELLKKEEKNIKILSLLGEIKGLLINIYT